MPYLINVCCICGIVKGEKPADNIAEDKLSHGLCESRACQSKAALIGNGLMPRQKAPPAWSPLRRA